jgi:hypothetical protein
MASTIGYYQQFVGNGAGSGGQFLDRQVRAPELDPIADRHRRQVGDIDRNHVHRHAAGQRRALSADQHRCAVGNAARQAIAIAGGHNRQARGALRAPHTPVADALAGRDFAQRDHSAFERHCRPQAELRSALCSERRHPVQRQARPHPGGMGRGLRQDGG